MKIRLSILLTAALVALAPTASFADLGAYTQDFEGLDQTDPGALAGDGWLVFANVFSPTWGYLYGYGPFPAPNGGPGFSGIDVNQGGPDQGLQQLVVYSDYNNGDHAAGRWIEANVFQEQVVGPADVGTTWVFNFDAKRGNIAGATTAKAFFKTLDPANGYQLTNFIWTDMTNVPADWDSYSLAITIDPSLVGQILQFGFLNTATYYEGSGIFYDNIEFIRSVGFDIKPGGCPNPINLQGRGLTPAAVVGTADFDVTMIDPDSLRLEGVAPVRAAFDDDAAPYFGEMCGCTENDSDGLLDLVLKFSTRDLLNALGTDVEGEVVLTLTGTFLDGTPFQGQDCALIFQVGGGAASSPDVIDAEAPTSPTIGGSTGPSSFGLN